MHRWVHAAGNLTAKMQTPKAVHCSGIVGIVDAGTATIVWTNPANFGKTTMKLNMKITSTSGHVTSGTLSGVVTTAGSNFASGKAVTGAFTLGKGLHSTQSGGDCTVILSSRPSRSRQCHCTRDLTGT